MSVHLCTRVVCSTVLFLCLFQLNSVRGDNDVKAEPGFKDILLGWQDRSTGDGSGVFKIKYCENQIWGEHFCRRKLIRPNPQANIYSYKLKGLKMDTEYVIYLMKHAKRERALRLRSKKEDDINLRVFWQEKIVARTLGFSAKARDCGPAHTDVDVQTGPSFTGRISAEGSFHPACSIQGTGEGDVKSYSLNLNHKLCGTEVNETAAWTYVVVQENLPILTHSTKRFLVLCKFGLPDVFTVKSGLSLPYSKNLSPPNGVAVPERGARTFSGVQDANADDIITLDDYQDHEIAAFENKYDLIHGRHHKKALREHFNQRGKAAEEHVRSGKLSNLIASRQNIGEEGRFRKFIDADSLEGDIGDGVPETAIVLVFSIVGSIVILAACSLLLLCRKRDVEEEPDREQLRRTETLQHRPRRRRESRA